MSRKEKMLKNVKEIGVKFPSRQRFVLVYNEGRLGIMTTEIKGKIKLENEKVKQNRSFLINGSPTALLDVKDVKNAEEYVGILLQYHERWGLLEEEEEESS